VMASALYEVIPNLGLMGNVGWQNWTEFGEFPVGISAANQTTVNANLHFSNTYQPIVLFYSGNVILILSAPVDSALGSGLRASGGGRIMVSEFRFQAMRNERLSLLKILSEPLFERGRGF